MKFVAKIWIYLDTVKNETMKQSEILQLLPEIFQRTTTPENPLMVLLEVMEHMHAPAEGVLDGLDRFFDPRRAPDKFVAFLATWVDLASLLRDSPASDESAMDTATSMTAPLDALSTGTGRLRELVAAAAYLSQWRGTRQGLLHFLETATGLTGFEIDEAVVEKNQVIPYHLLIIAPGRARPYQSLLHRIITLEKPAYVTYELAFAAEVAEE